MMRFTPHAIAHPLVFVCVMTIVVFETVVPTSANVRNGGGNNNQHVKPFYIVAHNPNQVFEAFQALQAGANALEPDVMKFNDSAHDPNGVRINSTAGASGLFMYHDDVSGFPFFDQASRMPTTVEEYFDWIHSFAITGTNVALITLDIKSPAANPTLVAALRNAVHQHLNHGTVHVNVIYSVASRSDAAAFSSIAPFLDANEGVQVDGENDPAAVFNFLLGQGARRIAFGNGTAGLDVPVPFCPQIDCAAPNVVKSIDEAAWIRAGQFWDRNQYIFGGPGFGIAVPYAYPIPVFAPPDIGIFSYGLINDGADGLIPDGSLNQPQDFSTTVSHIRHLRDFIDNYDQNHFVATVEDNPFLVPPESYALRVDTTDDFFHDTGTDDTITFKLTGDCNGGTSASISIDGRFYHHMRHDDRMYVVLPSKNLGRLTSLQLFSSGSNDWNPGGIQISSVRWGIPYSDNRFVDFNGDNVNSSSPQGRGLGGWGYACDTTPPTGTATQDPPPNAKGWNNSDVTLNWTWQDNPGGSGVRWVQCTQSKAWPFEGIVDVDGFCEDVDSNKARVSHTVRLDKTPPTVECGGPDGRWHGTDYSIGCTAVDPPSKTQDITNFVSGLANPADANFSVSTNVPPNTETSNASTVPYTVFDNADNGTQAGPIAGNKIDKKPPVIGISQPAPMAYPHSAALTLNYNAVDGGSGVAAVSSTIDGLASLGGSVLANGVTIPLLTSLALGSHTFTVDSTDAVGNKSTFSVTFSIIVTPQSIVQDIALLQGAGVNQKGDSLTSKLTNAGASFAAGRCTPARNQYGAFINEVQAQTGKSITPVASAILIADAQYLIGICQ